MWIDTFDHQEYINTPQEKTKNMNNNNIEKTLEERGSRYGDFRGHALITQTLKSAIHNHDNWNNLRSDMKEALEMTMHKIGRILNGDPMYKDSWVDIEGYIHLVSKTLED